MGQYSSKTAVSLLAQDKTSTSHAKSSRKLKLGGKLDRSKSAEIINQVEKSNAIQIPGSTLSTVSNQITTINLHIENNGGVSATTSSHGITRTLKSEFEAGCDSHSCDCSTSSPRQLIIKIQLSKMEQTNADFENVTLNKHFECCDINHNKIKSSSLQIGESQHSIHKTNGVSVYVPKSVLSQDCLNESSTSSNLHSDIDVHVSSSSNTSKTEPTTKPVDNNLAILKAPTVAHSQVDFVHHLVPDLNSIINATYYWGKMDRYEAERLLEDKEEGTFLLRDSAQDDFLFSVTFRKYGLSLHARIEQSGNQFSFDCHDPSCICAPTITELLEHYKDPCCVMFFEPRLTIPLNRPNPFSLQQLCRAKIVSHTTYDGINQLELPCKLKAFLKEFHYKQKICTRSLESNRN